MKDIRRVIPEEVVNYPADDILPPSERHPCVLKFELTLYLSESDNIAESVGDFWKAQGDDVRVAVHFPLELLRPTKVELLPVNA
jgi:hypothetical protein